MSDGANDRTNNAEKPTRPTRRRRWMPVALLALLAGGGIAAWILWPSPQAPRAAAAHGDDDLEWLAAPKAAREAAQDAYTADPSGVYVASAREHAIRRVSLEANDASAAAGELLLRLGPHENVAVMATGNGTLCFASGVDGLRGRMTVRAGPEAQGPFAVVRADGPSVMAIACDRDAIFVVSADGDTNGLLQKSTVERLPIAIGAGGAIAAIGAGDASSAAVAIGHSDGALTSLAVDEAHVYWADSLDEKIVAVAKTGGTPAALAEGRGLPRSIAAFGDALYWVEQRGESVWTLPKSGGTPRLVVQDFAGFAHLAVGPGGVFWVNESAVAGGFRVLRSPLGGGDATALAPASPPVDGIDAVVVVGAKVVWARDGQLSASVAATAPSR